MLEATAKGAGHAGRRYVGLSETSLIEAGGSIVGVRRGTEEPVYTVEQASLGARDPPLRSRGSLQRRRSPPGK